jgi:hypothetical protein
MRVLRHEIERLRTENAALSRAAAGHGGADLEKTENLRQLVQEIAAELVTRAASADAEVAARVDGELARMPPKADPVPLPVGAPPSSGGPTLSARLRALRSR